MRAPIYRKLFVKREKIKPSFTKSKYLWSMDQLMKLARLCQMLSCLRTRTNEVIYSTLIVSYCGSEVHMWNIYLAATERSGKRTTISPVFSNATLYSIYLRILQKLRRLKIFASTDLYLIMSLSIVLTKHKFNSRKLRETRYTKTVWILFT